VTEPRQHYGLTLAVLAVAALAFALSQTMVAPALPEIQHDLGTSTTTVTWVLTVYLLTASVATPIGLHRGVRALRDRGTHRVRRGAGGAATAQAADERWRARDSRAQGGLTPGHRLRRGRTYSAASSTDASSVS
jgi:MFS family permease